VETEIMIDPNVRVAGNETFSGFEDVRGPMPVAGQHVVVREPEGDLIGAGVVTRLDQAARLIYIAVNWPSLVPDVAPTPDQLLPHPGASYAVAETETQCYVEGGFVRAPGSVLTGV
jgi:hypothetical protein